MEHVLDEIATPLDFLRFLSLAKMHSFVVTGPYPEHRAAGLVAMREMCYRDEMRTRQQIMRSVAIGRVLERARDRRAIGSPRDLRLAYLNELATYGEEIAAETYRILALARQAELAVTRKALRCVICGGPIGGAQRPSRRYCSDRCRQRAHRRRVSPVAMESIER